MNMDMAMEHRELTMLIMMVVNIKMAVAMNEHGIMDFCCLYFRSFRMKMRNEMKVKIDSMRVSRKL